jgi:hypothetical protein
MIDFSAVQDTSQALTQTGKNGLMALVKPRPEWNNQILTFGGRTALPAGPSYEP